MSLYQKYRPIDFSSLIGQSFVSKALTAALVGNKTVGVYLFCGSRGTGKTSVARILAKAMNCSALIPDGNPCGVCANCVAAANNSMLDIIEIDGASNNGVANVRELIERARFQPSMGSYKVYIIDEVHMLSGGAFNALLKILEEPPVHVKFILATTESHKIPDTIISRSQRYDFRKISEADIIGRLQFVAEQESIQADTAALALVAKLARGGLRDALSLFEQYTIAGVLSYDFMMENLSLLGDDFLATLTQSILTKDIDALLQAMDTLRARSIDARRFTEELLGYIRTRSLALARTAEFVPLWLVFRVLSEAYTRLKEFPDGFMLIEMTLLGVMTQADSTPVAKNPGISNSQSPATRIS
jgi:DNA polymerase-3 subunit gamma/tau